MTPTPPQPSPSNVMITTTGSAVQANIAKFGGTVSLVQKRKDQLQKKWDLDKAPKISVKSKWYTSPQSGRYRKRIVVERHY